MPKKIDFLVVFLIALISVFFVFDIFLNTGQPATFDGTTHITTIAQFYRGLTDGEIRVTWADNFANYGMPIPLIAQQTTPYLGAIINFVSKDVLLSFNIVFLLGAFLSALFYYIFLRIYFTPLLSFVGTFLFSFAPYRIINLYIRAAQPEFFAAVFIPLILIGIYLIIKKKNPFGILLLGISTAFIILTHPFAFVISAVIFTPYLIICLQDESNKFEPLIHTLFSIIIGVGISAFYTLPLFAEIKYFHYGNNKDHLVPNQYLGLSNFFDPNWYYYYKNDVFVRGNFIKVGLLESIITIIGVIFAALQLVKKGKEKLLYFSVFTSLILIFLTTAYADLLYQNIGLLNGIQYPWRMLLSLNLITPIILVILLTKIKKRKIAAIALITLIAFVRFPQVYGKNYTLYDKDHYAFTTENLHGNVLNTLWTGKTSEYPRKYQKAEIIDGTGKIINKIVKNSYREYQINATTDLRMADNTFYFPGWWVYVDGSRTPIQYQDPAYRGIITYNVPKGNHLVKIRFENTKPRIIGYFLSLISLIMLSLFFVIAKKRIRFFYSAIPKALRR